MTDNVHPLFPDLHPDHDEDGDGISESTELTAYEPVPLPVTVDNDGTLVTASVIDSLRIIPTRDEARSWLDDCYWGIRLRVRKAWVHAISSPLYAGRASRHSPRGLWIVACYWWAWVRDWEILDDIDALRRDAAVDARATATTAADRRAERTIRVRWRWGITIAGLILAPLLYRWAWDYHLLYAVAVTLAAVVGLGLIGAQRGDVVQYVDEPTEMNLTIDAVINAFYKAKIAPKPDEPVRVLGVPHKVGLGTLIRVELPSGIEYDEVISRQNKLASGLHCPRQCLDLDPLDDEAEGVLEIFVADLPPSKIKVPAWPLLLAARADVFHGIPVGWTPKGELIHLSLLWVHTLIGAAPRRGKSNLLRMLALATLMDPRARLVVVDFGGGADYTAMRPYCDTFIHGPSAAKIEEFLDLLGRLNAEYERRQALLAALPVDECPEARLTPALAERPEFAPITVIVDEFQVATRAKKVGDEAKMGELIVETWTELEKVCAKVGITFLKATQTADDSVPTELRNISLQRVALSMASYQASMAILGNTAQKLGYDASTLGGLPGLAYSWGTDSGEVDGYRGRLRFAEVKPADAAALMQRIAAIRTPRQITQAPAMLAIDDEPDAAPIPQIVADVLRVWPQGEVVAHLHDLAESLGVTRAEVSGPLRKLGLAPHQNLKIRGVNRSGYDLIDVQKLAEGHRQ